MATNPAVPFYSEGYIFTCHAGAAITGKRFVRVSANANGERPVVALAGAGALDVLGVSGYDAASGDGVTVYRKPSVMPVRAGATITAGQRVESNANGEAIPTVTAGAACGIALADAASGADAKIALI